MTIEIPDITLADVLNFAIGFLLAFLIVRILTSPTHVLYFEFRATRKVKPPPVEGGGLDEPIN